MNTIINTITSTPACNAVSIKSRIYPWAFGNVDGHEFKAKVYDDGSGYGINKGRVSKLSIFDKDTGDAMVSYDRGWDIRPTTPKAKAAFDSVMKALEGLKLETRKPWHRVSYKGGTYFSECVDEFGSGWWLSKKDGDRDRGMWAKPSDVKVLNAVSPRVAAIVANALSPVCNGKFKVGDKVKMRLTGTVYTVKRIDGNRLYIGDGNSYVTDYDVTPINNCVSSDGVTRNDAAYRKDMVAKIRQAIRPLESRMWNDSNWQGPIEIKKAIEKLGYVVHLSPARDGGYRAGGKTKLYTLEVLAGNEKLDGAIQCMAAGTVEDPWAKYDMAVTF